MQFQWNWWGGQLKFDLVTSHLSSDYQVTRNRISWLGATLLSLYHLHITNTSSNLGFYHWRNDIALLIATHWSSIFGHAVKKKKTWQVCSLFLFLHITTQFCFAGFCLWLSFWQLFHIVWVWSLYNRRTGMVAPQESRSPCNSTEQDAS